jgi:hypothetical protein
MKKRLILCLGVAMLLSLATVQVAYADPPGPAGSKDCIGFCVSQGFNGTMPVDEFARLHNPSVGGGCGMFKKLGIETIRDANPPQP